MNAIFDPQEYFDKIFCISVDSRVDRRETAKEAFVKLGIMDRVEFVLVQKHPTNPEEGIFNSHLHCLSRGLKEGGEHILIFEDDIVVEHFSAPRIADAVKMLQQQKWEAFFLGAIRSKNRKTESGSLEWIEYRCLTHGYALNRHFARKIIQEKWGGVAYDGVLKKRCSKSFAPVPMIAFQNTSFSDNRTIFLDKIRRVFGGLQFLQRSNELLHRYLVPIVTVHLLVLVAVVLLVVCV
ncbi:MAG: hypothetical protein DSY80_09890 [Desulfocapsa sp.]|nr:MAG: hypothetical protein DSY80_09890 [Desulfocapsa sp.]